MFKIRKKPRAYHQHLRLVEETMNKTDEAGQPEVPVDQAYKQVTLTFVCPPSFDPAAFIITAMNKEGQHFTNAPTNQPHLALRLATLALDFASYRAVLHIQQELLKKSPIVQVPPGTTLPEWKGPEGRG